MRKQIFFYWEVIGKEDCFQACLKFCIYHHRPHLGGGRLVRCEIPEISNPWIWIPISGRMVETVTRDYTQDKLGVVGLGIRGTI